MQFVKLVELRRYRLRLRLYCSCYLQKKDHFPNIFLIDTCNPCYNILTPTINTKKVLLPSTKILCTNVTFILRNVINFKDNHKHAKLREYLKFNIIDSNSNSN